MFSRRSQPYPFSKQLQGLFDDIQAVRMNRSREAVVEPNQKRQLNLHNAADACLARADSEADFGAGLEL
jgi:hypothetical protein